MTTSLSYRRRLVVMVKKPQPGRVKTRLGATMGNTGAAWWFRHQVARLLRQVSDPRWDIILATSPNHDAKNFPMWPQEFPRVPQGMGDLGDRMARMFRSMPPGPVCIIGADIPGVDRPAIAQAFAALGDHQACFGPAPDGGYWLVGLKRDRPPPTTLFQNVRWSSPHALADSQASMTGLSIAEVTTLRDVDTEADLELLQRPRN